MNIFANLARNTGADVAEDELTPEELAEAKRREQQRINKLRGPEKVKYLTNGQVRRRAIRQSKAEHRKTNRRYRREWMLKQQILANVRGQLRTLELETAPNALRSNALHGIMLRFGEFDADRDLANNPVEAAREFVKAAA